MKQKEEKAVLDTQEQNKLINLAEDKKFPPKTEPQISPDMYAKWLTDKYNKEIRDSNEYKNKLLKQIEELKQQNKDLRKLVDEKRLKYMNDKREFDSQLMKDDVIQKYKREVLNLQKALARSRKDNEQLIVENLKLKNKVSL